MERTLKLMVLISIMFLTGCYAAIVGTAAVGAAYAYDRRTIGTALDDQSIGIKAKLALARNKDLWQNSHVDVVAYNNVILLVGQTPNQEFKLKAENLIADVPGIRKVYNELTVGKPLSVQKRITDSYLTSRAKLNIAKNGNLGLNRVKVTTEGSVIYLMGIVTPAEESQAVEIVRRIPGVKKVVKIFEQH